MTDTRTRPQTRIRWPEVIERAAEIAGSYSTPVTLRQLHYRLVAEHLIPNTRSAYKSLSSESAKARRAGVFPALTDRGRRIENLWSYSDPAEAVGRLARGYRRDRTAGQDEAVWVVVEKDTLIEQITAWVDGYGIPVVALRGYGSQTIIDDVRGEVLADGRDTTAVYIGDLDASGEDIERDFHERTDYCFADVRRVAVTFEQIDTLGLEPVPGKSADSRAGRFVENYGELIAVEVEAIDPAELERLVRREVEAIVDLDLLGQVRNREDRERALLVDAARRLADVGGVDDDE